MKRLKSATGNIKFGVTLESDGEVDVLSKKFYREARLINGLQVVHPRY